MRWFACVLAASFLIAVPEAGAQYRFDSEVYRDWADDANGRPCETQLEGYLPRTFSDVYPPDALRSRTSGEVLLTFDTSYRDGVLSTENARVFRSDPAGVFDETALALAREFVFPPTMRNCGGIRAILRFVANSANADGAMRGAITSSLTIPPLRPETARAVLDSRLSTHCGVEGAVNTNDFGLALISLYPERAMQRDREGFAVIRFAIAPDGSVSGPVVLEEFPAGLGFGEAGAQAILVARYPQRTDACEGAVVTVRFRLS